MNVWIPWTDLAPETRDFAGEVGANLYQLSDSDEGYGRFMAERWEEGRPFMVVEHDVVPTQVAAMLLWNCERPTLCCHGYEGEDRRTLMFGCVRFSSDFIAAWPMLWTDYLAARDVPEGHRDYEFSAARCRRWMMLPEWVDHATRARAHFHGRVRHLARMAGNR